MLISKEKYLSKRKFCGIDQVMAQSYMAGVVRHGERKEGDYNLTCVEITLKIEYTPMVYSPKSCSQMYFEGIEK